MKEYINYLLGFWYFYNLKIPLFEWIIMKNVAKIVGFHSFLKFENFGNSNNVEESVFSKSRMEVDSRPSEKFRIQCDK